MINKSIFIFKTIIILVFVDKIIKIKIMFTKE